MPPQPQPPTNLLQYLKGLQPSMSGGTDMFGKQTPGFPSLGKNKFGNFGNYVDNNPAFQGQEDDFDPLLQLLSKMVADLGAGAAPIQNADSLGLSGGGTGGGSKPDYSMVKPGKLNTGFGEDQTSQFAGVTSTSAPTPTPTPGPLQDFAKSITNPMEWAMSKAPDRSRGQYGTQPPAYRPQKERNIAREAFGADRAMKTFAGAPKAPRPSFQRRPVQGRKRAPTRKPTPLLRRSQVARNSKNSGSGFRK